MTGRRRGSDVDTELLTRTSWVNAEIAYKQVKKGKADGNKCALYLRWHLQKYMYKIGCFIQLHCGKVLFLGILMLSMCCIGLKTAVIETDVKELWVEDGGRLSEELKYTRDTIGEGTGTTSELIIQTPRIGENLLTVPSLQLHLDTLLKVANLEIELYGITWKFHDLCYLADLPQFDDTVIDSIIEKILPCVIVTPLDCFWDGAKVLGPTHSVATALGFPTIKWVDLNPMELVQLMSDHIDTTMVEKMLNRSGITTGYVEKPCLDPTEFQCPDTAPNKHSLQPPDIGGLLTDGCYGFATKYMHWHEDLIVGGVQKNKTGHIVRAEALQSIIQLMAEQDLYTYWHESMKTQSIEWTKDKAKGVLEAWQRKFIEVVNGMTNSSSVDDVYAFSSTSLLDIMKEFSNVSIVRVAFGYILMIFYACVSLLRWQNGVQSQSGIGIAGVLLVALSVAAGLGMCSVLGISFNASTTQIIPFLALGLGVDDMFLIAHTYAENGSNQNIAHAEQTGECLKRTGVSVLLTSISNMLAFFSAAIIPIPALRSFSLQAGILIFFNLASVLLVYPAICSWDLKRRDDKRIDIFCCFQSYESSNMVIELQPRSEFEMHEQSPPPRYSPPPPRYSPSPPPSYNSVIMHNTVAQTALDGSHASTSLAEEGRASPASSSFSANYPATSSSQQRLTVSNGISFRERFARAQRGCLSTTLSSLATKYYGPFLQKTPTKVFAVLFFFILLILGIYGTTKVKDGLDLTDVVPKGTTEYSFLETQTKYFGFYNIYLVTKGGYDYPNNQNLLYEYHRAFQSVGRIIKREDGTMPNFWLPLFRQWLQELQKAFDKDILLGSINQNGWHSNASHDGILAYKLLAQTGDIDNPIDKQRPFQNRLVDTKGLISTEAFYNYLTAWVTNDALVYASSMADFHPLPKQWIHDAFDRDFNIPKAQPLIYTQLPFYLTNLSTTEAVLDTVIAIRSICDTYTDKGLPNYPSGIPFTFWEQYINLRFYLMLAILCVLLVTFVVLTIVLMNPWLASIVVVVLTLILVELFGFMGLSEIKLSAIPAVILIIAVGIGVEFTVHISVGFLTAIGSRNKRMVMSLEHTFAPVIHGAISTLLGIVMLVGAEFDFIVKYFFNVLAGLVVIGLLNGLVLLPVLLSVIGPNGEVRPKDNEDRLATPSPEPSPKLKERKPTKSKSKRSRRKLYPRMPSDLSLTTISEEPTQYSSHEIIVEPKVVVETTTVPMDGGGGAGGGAVGGDNYNSSRNSTPPESSSSTPQSTHVTRVKATATVKVEVHTPIPGVVQNVSDDHVYNSYKRRKAKELEQSSDSDSSTNS